MDKPKILIQFDPDRHASVFDAVVAIDSGVDHLLQYAAVEAPEVRALVHGAMFTRGPKDLKSTAIFIGGSNVAQGESLLAEVTGSFFGPMRVSVMFDANGANTTAAAALLAAAKHVELAGAEVLVLASTGPVGQRLVRLLAREGAKVRAASRDLQRAAEVCRNLSGLVENAQLTPVAVGSDELTREALRGVRAVISAGAAGVQLLSADQLSSATELKVAIDLNAVPPLGIEGIEVTDAGKDRNGVALYGAIGVGGTKMKIHKAAIRQLFEANDQLLDAEQILAVGRRA